MELGIDFGTTYSTLCFNPDLGAEGCVREARVVYIPTIIAFRQDGTFCVGNAALAETGVALYRDIKRWVGCNYINEKEYRKKLAPTYKVQVNKYECSIGAINAPNAPLRRVVVLIALFIKGCISLLQQQTGKTVRFCTCSVPAEYNSFKRSYVFKACEALNIGVQAVVNEPTAAAFSAFSNEQSDTIKTLIVYDFGGGTFDTSLLLKSPGYMTVLDSQGDNYLGGRDVDEKLKEEVSKRLGVSTAEISSFVMEDLKLSLVNKPHINTHEIATTTGRLLHLNFSAQDFSTLCSSFVQRAARLVDAVLKRNNVHAATAVLIGGSSVLPGVRESLLNIPAVKAISFTRDTYRVAVAIGAARYASTFVSSSRFRLVDCVAATLSDDKRPYIAAVVVPKGYVVPCTVEYDWVMPNFNTALVFHEGESPNALLNERCYSADLSLSQFKAGTRGKVVVKFSEDGRVSATFAGQPLVNEVSLAVVTSGELQAKFETLAERKFKPNVARYQRTFEAYSRETSVATKSLRERSDLYKRHGFDSI
nr:heat shock protein 70-like protein [Sugarcane mild mosaic virus]WAA68721.1 heat shock protein 70-like protein [Sugarcane mild mosaic virus]